MNQIDQFTEETKQLGRDFVAIGTETRKIVNLPYGWIPVISLLGLIGLVAHALSH